MFKPEKYNFSVGFWGWVDHVFKPDILEVDHVLKPSMVYIFKKASFCREKPF